MERWVLRGRRIKGWICKRRRFFSSLGLFLFALPLFWGLEKGLERVLRAEIEERTYLERATIRNKILAAKYEAAKPIRNPRIEDLKLEAKAGGLFYVKGEDKRVLFEKKADKQLPIASLTKLMTVLVVREENGLKGATTVTPKAAEKEGGPNFFRSGEKFSLRTLASAALVESSNRAAFSLSQVTEEEAFLWKMNEKAEELGMKKTAFFNPTGLDPDSNSQSPNLSSVQDLSLLAERLLGDPLVKKAARAKVIPIRDTEGDFHHNAFNTNELAGKFDGLLLSKTGQTPSAGECLLLALPSRKEEGVLIAVVLGAENKFEEMQSLLDWAFGAYKW